MVSISNGTRVNHESGVETYSEDPRSSVRIIEARGSGLRIEGTPEMRERDTERYSYGTSGGAHRRTGSVSYVNPRASSGSVHGHSRGLSGGSGVGGGGRMSREKVILVDRE